MSFEIYCRDFWTYNITIPNSRKSEAEKRLPLEFLKENECTHIHGDLQLLIDGRIVPYMGSGTVDAVCIGYWVEMIAKMFNSFKSNEQLYIIEGGDQGKPAYKFEKESNYLFLSIIDSELGGKKDLNWQRVKIPFRDFKDAFLEFKEKLLLEIALKSPDMLEIWSNKFYKY